MVTAAQFHNIGESYLGRVARLRPLNEQNARQTEQNIILGDLAVGEVNPDNIESYRPKTDVPTRNANFKVERSITCSSFLNVYTVAKPIFTEIIVFCFGGILPLCSPPPHLNYILPRYIPKLFYAFGEASEMWISHVGGLLCASSDY